MSDQKPFNDAVEHMERIEGLPSQTDMKKLPRPIRYFGYFFLGFFAVSLLFIVLGVLIT
ncbi:amino acid transporter [Metabacillus indicus]|uniref:amino acid transporter n=1 Tax=Metabacillus indicus TaxID=246786 RepID=UPI002A032C50|nr:amino acid transporter [Metabacillus indicus]MDX8289315.1 amino acid transporter [Metabacillus indicus]